MARRARWLIEQKQVLETLGNIVEGKEMEPRFIERRKLDDGTIVNEVVYAPPLNSQKIAAAHELLEVAGARAHAPEEGNEPDVEWIVILPVRARTTREWLKMHKLGKA